jgi:hypothetical protein
VEHINFARISQRAVQFLQDSKDSTEEKEALMRRIRWSVL